MAAKFAIAGKGTVSTLPVLSATTAVTPSWGRGASWTIIVSPPTTAVTVTATFEAFITMGTTRPASAVWRTVFVAPFLLRSGNLKVYKVISRKKPGNVARKGTIPDRQTDIEGEYSRILRPPSSMPCALCIAAWPSPMVWY